MARERMVLMEQRLRALSGEEDKPLKDWLEEYLRKPDVANSYFKNFKVFLEWTKKTPKQLVEEFDQKETRSLLLKFQSYLSAQGYKNNTISSYLTTVRSFYLSQCEPIRKLKNKLVHPEAAMGEHVFSTDDLRKMWHIADTRNKALLAVGMSLGWEVGSVLDMEREFFENFVKRARSEKQDFIAFDWIRRKEQTTLYGVLSPCAIDSLERYLEKRKNDPDPRLWNTLTTEDSLNDALRSLVKEAGIVLTGKVRWHLLRKWLMSQLDAAGLSEFQNKLILGKKIGISDSTYLQSLKRESFEKYQKAYPLYLSPVAYTNGQSHMNNMESMIQKISNAMAVLIARELKQEGLLSMMSSEDIITNFTLYGTLLTPPKKEEEKKREQKES